MVKAKEDVIVQFNEKVNMSAEELQAWLDDPKSEKAGTGVGLESGHKSIEILKKNPDKDPEKYDEEDINHMRKVVGYINRHVAQEDHLKETKTKTELENAKSTISLKNWGHDPAKTMGDGKAKKQASDSDKHPAESNGKVSEDPSGPEDPQESTATAGTKSAKRKLALDTTDESNDDGVDVQEPGDNERDSEDDERARKKSKTADEPLESQTEKAAGNEAEPSA